MALLVALAAIASASCGAPLLKLPAGPGTPAPDATDALNDATAACRAVSTMTAEIGVSGSVGGRRLRGRLLAGVATGPPASARLEAVAPAGQPIFIFVAAGNDATLLLPRDNRVLQRGRPAAVLEAVAGVPLDATDLREALTGCPPLAAGMEGRQFGAEWRVVAVGSTDVYLRRAPQVARWQIAAAVHHPASSQDSGAVSRPGSAPATGGSGQVRGDGGWRAEYTDFQGGLPRSVRLVSADGRRFDLRLTLSQVGLNERLGPEAFRVRIPPDADPITLEELRDSGPFGSAPNSTQRTPRTQR